MARLDPDDILDWSFSKSQRTFDWRDTAFYALSLGFGDDPRFEDELDFVYEKRLRALPSLCNVIPRQGNWLFDKETSIDASRAVHAGHTVRLERPLPVEATVDIVARNIAIEDKGLDRGAMLYTRTQLLADDSLLAEIVAATYLRGQGGCGNRGVPVSIGSIIPERLPDRAVQIQISPQAAMLYRLNDDLNPLHIDIEVARDVGFDRPILHGLCTMGIAQRAILRGALNYRADRIASMAVRFSAPVYPGDELSVEIWNEDDRLIFRAYAGANRQLVIDRGLIILW